MKVSIPNLDVKVWTLKHDLTQGSYLCSLPKHEIKGQILFELAGIEYDIIKY